MNITIDLGKIFAALFIYLGLTEAAKVVADAIKGLRNKEESKSEAEE